MRKYAIHAGTLLLLASSRMLPAQEVEAPPIEPAYTTEVETLLAESSVKAAMDHIVSIEPQSRRDLIELTEIPAPPFEEQARGERFAEMLRDAGLADVSIDDVGNVIGKRPGRSGDRIVAYAAHLDTVFPAGTDVP